MIIKVHKGFKHLLENANDRQKLWLAFWSHIYTTVPTETWMNLNPVDYEFMLGIDEKLYQMNAVGSTTNESHFNNYVQKRHMGEEFATEFQWRFENKQNVMWKSRTLSTEYPGLLSKPTVETELTDHKTINCWCYVLGRLEAGNLITTFKWFDTGNYTVDRMSLDAMGHRNR